MIPLQCGECEGDTDYMYNDSIEIDVEDAPGRLDALIALAEHFDRLFKSVLTVVITVESLSIAQYNWPYISDTH